MTIASFFTELKNFKFSSYKLINLSFAAVALLLYEFVGRSIYRPYIYENNIYDFHIADTLGNSLGAVATIFFLVFLFSTEKTKGNYMIKIGTMGVVCFELLHPILGKPIDFYDIAATMITGVICNFLYNFVFGKQKNENQV